MSDDQDLLQRMSRGDDSALREFYMRHEGPVFRYIQSILNDPAESGDVLNEVMFEVWRGAGNFEGRSKVSTWVFGIARNKSIDRLRKRRPDLSDELDMDIEDEDNPGPEVNVAAAEDAGLVQDCIESLQVKHREVVHLAFFEDLGYREIAERVDCPEGTVKTRMFHAKRALQHCLERSGVAR